MFRVVLASETLLACPRSRGISFPDIATDDTWSRDLLSFRVVGDAFQHVHPAVFVVRTSVTISPAIYTTIVEKILFTQFLPNNYYPKTTIVKNPSTY